MHLSTLLSSAGFLLLWVLPSSFRCETVNCTGVYSCFRTNVTCVEDNPCIIDCLGGASCLFATLTCKDNQPCYINSDGISAVQLSTVNCPDNNDCIMNGTQANNGFRDSLVNCGINGSCYFLFEYVSGVTNFHFFNMNATHSRYVKMYKFGNPGAAVVISNISCPINNNGGGSSCDIICGGGTRGCDNMYIYAVEGFNDVNITETLDNDFGNSYMWCTDDYDIGCAINSTDPTQCVNTNNICNNYVSPS